ncbi:PfkB family carbohydrate kinase [Clostridium sp. DL1XJH146]
MTKREEEVLKILEKNPMISQRELAEKLNITRSSAAVHITNLMKKGLIVGKGYILKQHEYVVVIGGANVDIQGFSNEKFIMHDSNPGKVRISLGGVGRNIAENISRIGIETKLITILGDDVYGKKIIEEGSLCGIDFSHSLILSGENTSNYLCLADDKGEMMGAIASMDIFDKLDKHYIKDKKRIINHSQLCVLDTNVSEEVLRYCTSEIEGVNFFLDTVSTTKAKKVKDFVGKFHTIKPNKYEVEVLTGIEINNDDDLMKASEYLLNKGVKRVFISLGDQGGFYRDAKNYGKIFPPKVEIQNVTGAGDAFLAALAYAHINEYDLEKTAKFATSAAAFAATHRDTINPNISIENIEILEKEI